MTRTDDDAALAHADAAREIPPTDFTASDFAQAGLETEAELDPDWWSESTDGCCSEDAALFAASQPAPLNVV